MEGTHEHSVTAAPLTGTSEKRRTSAATVSGIGSRSSGGTVGNRKFGSASWDPEGVANDTRTTGQTSAMAASAAEETTTVQAAAGDQATNLDIEKIVDAATTSSSKKVIETILEQVNQLTPVEKLFLYLKLPVGKTVEDPLKQATNVLGGRFEIQQTIAWIKTHFTENHEVSLPKQEVYEEYLEYCTRNTMKPLSTADFGKVMKQVFKEVRPRRLGTRGNSRYCYAGLQKKLKLEPPQLPDLQKSRFDKAATGSLCEDDVSSAASVLIREWAEKLLGTKFNALTDLARYLIENTCVDNRSVAAFSLLSSFAKTSNKKGSSLLLNQGLQSKGKHRETQLQLQRKLQEKELIREQKRKLQEQQTALNRSVKRSKTSHQKGTDISATASVSTEIPADVIIPNVLYDKLVSTTIKEQARRTIVRPTQDIEHAVPAAADPVCSGTTARVPTSCIATDAVLQPKEEHTGKVAIPRLPRRVKQKASSGVVVIPSVPRPNQSKYKPIQPKLVHVPSVPSGDALADVLHEGNSQEHEEELLHYFKDSRKADEGNFKEALRKTDDGNQVKISQLRMLLEKNLVKPVADETESAPGPNGAWFSAYTERPPQIEQSSRRKVSFDVSSDACSAVPPSPNTRRRAFDFTPISPSAVPPSEIVPVGSPTGKVAPSPFVSPRGTPVCRSRHDSGQMPQVTTPRGTPYSQLSDVSRAATCGSEGGTPFVSPQSTPIPFARSRHSSSQGGWILPQYNQSRSRHSSGAGLYQRIVPNSPAMPFSPQSSCGNGSTGDEAGVPYFAVPDGSMRLRSRHSSANSVPPESPGSAPHSPPTLAKTDLRRRHQSAGVVGSHRPCPQQWSTPDMGLHDSTAVLQNGASCYVNRNFQRSQSVPLHEMLRNTTPANFYVSFLSHPSTPNIERSFSFPAGSCSGEGSYDPTPVPSDFGDFGNNDGLPSLDGSTLLETLDSLDAGHETLSEDNIENLFETYVDVTKAVDCSTTPSSNSQPDSGFADGNHHLVQGTFDYVSPACGLEHNTSVVDERQMLAEDTDFDIALDDLHYDSNLTNFVQEMENGEVAPK